VIVGGTLDGPAIFKDVALSCPTPDGGDSGLDLFVVKYDKDGNLPWEHGAVAFCGLDDQRMTSIALDPQGNIVIAGYFHGSVAFESETLDADLTSRSD